MRITASISPDVLGETQWESENTSSNKSGIKHHLGDVVPAQVICDNTSVVLKFTCVSPFKGTQCCFLCVTPHWKHRNTQHKSNLNILSASVTQFTKLSKKKLKKLHFKHK